MDKKELYQKAEKVLNQAFESAKQSAKIVSEKAGEAAHVTKLMIEKAALEHKASKKFTQLGHAVYEKSTSGTKAKAGDDKQIQAVINEIETVEHEIDSVEKKIKAEKTGKKK